MKNNRITSIILLFFGIILFAGLYYVSINIQPILSPGDNYRLEIAGIAFVAIFSVLASIVGFVNDSLDIREKIFPKNEGKNKAETLEHRNRRILLGHVENAWIKGVLDASLHGAALLDLGIKQDPEAVTKYPWAIKKESTDETLPAGTSILEIFDSIGMGRSLLILGAPGSGKTTMLLELARQLIARTREDGTQPIPMVFNLSSWTEKLTLADWLAQELNNLYSVPRKTAPDWVEGDKLLLLLDGLDEVRQESRAKCVEAINTFRKDHGLTSLAVCSRSQDYADLSTKLSFEGAIEIQSLTQEQIHIFFNRFGDEMAGIKQVLQKDNALREMAETPLLLSIMIMAYRNKRDVEILTSKDEKAQRKHLFDIYIESMFERPRLKNMHFKKQDILHWLVWLSKKMSTYNQVPYLLNRMQPSWAIENKQRRWYQFLISIIMGSVIGLTVGSAMCIGLGIKYGLIFGVIAGLAIAMIYAQAEITNVEILIWSLEQARKEIIGWIISITTAGFAIMFLSGISDKLKWGIFVGLTVLLIGPMVSGLKRQDLNQKIYPEQRIFSSIRLLIIFILIGGLMGLLLGVLKSELLGFNLGLLNGMIRSIVAGLVTGFMMSVNFGGDAFVQHYTLRYILARNNLLPWRLVPFLNHCVDLIFLRRVGGGYIFVHRLLMEHFAEMYERS